MRFHFDCIYTALSLTRDYQPSPGFLAYTIRDGVVGAVICLVIACYLLQEHIRASGGFRNSFTQSKGVSNTIGIVLIMVYPVWRLVLFFL